MNPFRYRLYSITIESEIQLPELKEDHTNQPDVYIILGDVPKHLPVALSGGVFYEVAYNDYLLNLGAVGSFRAENGTRITVMPGQNSDPSEIRLYLLGSVIGAILHQRGVLPIHGSTILTTGGALTITGNSSAGKSSIAAGFVNEGYKLLSDDISAVTFAKNSSFFVHPGIPYLKLWKDILIHLNRLEKLEKVKPLLEKYKLPLSEAFHNKCEKLHTIVYLSPNNRAKFHNTEIFGAEKFNILSNNIYRNNLIEGLGLSQQHFEQVANLAMNIRLFKLERPSNPIMIKELAHYVINKIIK